MKPEAAPKAPVLSKPEEYSASGIPAEWIEALQALGYTTIDQNIKPQLLGWGFFVTWLALYICIDFEPILIQMYR